MRWDSWFDKPAPASPAGPPRLTLECADIEAEHQRLIEAGIAVEELKGEAGGLRWFSISDPDGNVISFWQYG
jgi:hypothetical protein